MLEDFTRGERTTAVRQLVRENVYRVTLSSATVDEPRLPRFCASPEMFGPVVYSVRKNSAFSFAVASKELAGVNELEKPRSWRLPTALEGFAIATAMIYVDPDWGNLPFSFWVDDQVTQGTITITKEAGVDYQMVKGESSARLLMVQK
jgi:hypothetical protein